VLHSWPGYVSPVAKLRPGKPARRASLMFIGIFRLFTGSLSTETILEVRELWCRYRSFQWDKNDEFNCLGS
jgi:hypothetical protein